MSGGWSTGEIILTRKNKRVLGEKASRFNFERHKYHAVYKYVISLPAAPVSTSGEGMLQAVRLCYINWTSSNPVCTPHAAVLRFYRCILHCQTVTRFQRARFHVISFTPNSTALPAPNFTKFEKAQQQHYLHISSKEFHLNRAINVGSKGQKCIHTPEKIMAFQCTDFHETPNCSMTFLPDHFF